MYIIVNMYVCKHSGQQRYTHCKSSNNQFYSQINSSYVSFQVIVLQTYWRRWLAQRYVKGLRRDKLARDEWERQERLRKEREREMRAKRELSRRLNPRTKEDFELLYHALESEYMYTHSLYFLFRYLLFV